MADTTTLPDLPPEAAALFEEFAKEFTADREPKKDSPPPEPAPNGAATGGTDDPPAGGGMPPDSDKPPEAQPKPQSELKEFTEDHAAFGLSNECAELLKKIPVPTRNSLAELVNSNQAFRPKAKFSEQRLAEIKEGLDRKHERLSLLKAVMLAILKDQEQLAKLEKQLAKVPEQIAAVEKQRDGFKAELDKARAAPAPAAPTSEAVKQREDEIRTKAYSDGQAAARTEAEQAEARRREEAGRQPDDGILTKPRPRLPAAEEAEDLWWNNLPMWAKWTIGGVGGAVVTAMVVWAIVVIASI